MELIKEATLAMYVSAKHEYMLKRNISLCFIFAFKYYAEKTHLNSNTPLVLRAPGLDRYMHDELSS